MTRNLVTRPDGLSLQSFMKRVTLIDNAAGNALGWNPDGSTTQFYIRAANRRI
ncbi:MAG TPA: hypothetical protein VE544_10565 [Nitrososphaeraceae archaeon]|nr:hypothetical protein [Nitrososphaeraceae archaeon]